MATPLPPSFLCLMDDSSYYLLDNKLYRLSMGAGIWNTVCVFMCVCLFVFLCVCLSVFVSVYVFCICVYLLKFMEFCLGACVAINVCLYILVCLFV